MKKGNKEKSNRAQADYFELLVCQYICHLYKITFSYSEDLAKLSNKILELSELRSELILTNAELVKFRIKRNQNFVNDIRKMHIWVNRNEKISLFKKT